MKETETQLREPVFYVPGGHCIIDTATIKDGMLRSDITGETLEEVRLRHPDAQIGEFNDAWAGYEDEWKSEPAEITEEKFMEMLGVLPPVAWVNRIDSEFFKISERTVGMITGIYARISEPTTEGVENRYFTLSDSILTPHAEIITRCSKVPRQ